MNSSNAMRLPVLGLALAVLIALAGAGLYIVHEHVGVKPPAAGTAPLPPTQPRLIVVISVDQFGSELYKRYRPGFSGGLATLGSGLLYPTGYQAHAATETCPGHSTILSGRHPKTTGIIANIWYDRSSGSDRYCVAVPDNSDKMARGPQQMHGDTLGAWLKAAHPGARVFTVSGKDRAAIMLAGKGADGVYWWMDGKGFTTSSYAGPDGEAVTAPADRFNTRFWRDWKHKGQPLWPPLPDRCAALQTSGKYGDLAISGKVPTDLAVTEESFREPGEDKLFAAELRASPLLDQLTLDYAGEVITHNHLGRGEQPDLIAISLSATDYIGHRYGNGGAEMCGQMAALDAALGRFVTGLQALDVPYLVVLTADHGSTDAAERENLRSPPAARFDSEQFVKDLNMAMSVKFGLPYATIVGDGAQELYIRAGNADTIAMIRGAALEWLRARPEVREAHSAAEVAAASPPKGTPPDRLTVLQQLNLSYDPKRSADLFVVFAPRTSFGIPHNPGDVIAGHGSTWAYDHQVPVMFWWPGAPSRVRNTPIATVDIAPTLAALMGLPVPPVDGQCVSLGVQKPGCRAE